MKKRINRFSLFFILVSVIIGGVFAVVWFQGENDYVRITDLQYQALVVDEPGGNGKVIIKERLTFDVHAASENNLFWELWRELPEAYYDGVLVDYNVLSVKEIFADGSELIYPEAPKLYWWDDDYINTDIGLGPNKWYHSPGPYDDYYFYESLIFYVDGLYRDTIVYEIEYEMNNAVLRYQDASELYLAFYSGPTTKYLNSVKGEILVPIELMPASDNYHAYTYGTNSHQFDFVESTTLHPGYHTFTFDLNKSDLKFKAYNNYLEFALVAFGEDAHKFSKYASENYYYNSDMLAAINRSQANYEALPEIYYQKKLNTLTISSIFSAITLIVVFLINAYFKGKYKLFKPTLEIDYFRDIPSPLDANFARKLVFSKHQEVDDMGDGYAAAMLSLADKGYLEMRQLSPTKKIKDDNILIELKPNLAPDAVDLREPLSSVERAYLNLITRHTTQNAITVKDFQNKVKNDYEYTNNFLTEVKNAVGSIGVNQGYFQKLNFKSPKQAFRAWAGIYVFLAFLIMLVGHLIIFETRYDLAFGSFFVIGGVMLLGAILLVFLSRKYILLTQFGEDEYNKWRGLYNFLNDETLMVERGVMELAIWEKYLIYATAFGISDKVIKALKVVIPEAMLASSPILYNNVFRSRSFYNTTSRSFSSATRSASYTARSGGHGGYGGGGRGGGGGGGGH